jgi:hypothetical protein
MQKLKKLYPIIISSIMLFVNLSCDKSNEKNQDLTQTVSSRKYKISEKDIEQLKYTEFALSDLSDSSTKDWLKFQEFLTQIELLKKGSLSFIKDDKTILKSFVTDMKKEIPEVINSPSILVRLSVLETTLFKLEGVSNIYDIEKDILLNAIKEVLVAHSNLILQINKKFEKDSQNIKKPN